MTQLCKYIDWPSCIEKWWVIHSLHAAAITHAILDKSVKSFKSLLQNTIGKNASQYTVNKHTYIYSVYINTKTYQQINVLHYKYNDISTNQRPSL